MACARLQLHSLIDRHLSNDKFVDKYVTGNDSFGNALAVSLHGPCCLLYALLLAMLSARLPIVQSSTLSHSACQCLHMAALALHRHYLV